MNPFARYSVGLGAVVALVTGVALSSVPAQAAQHNLKSVDITGYKVADIVVSDANCKFPSVKALIQKKTSSVTSFTSTVDLMRNGKQVTDTIVGLNDLTDKFVLCPVETGLGKYTVGPAASFAEYTYEQGSTTYESGISYNDNTKNNFYVRGVVKNSLTAKRKGSKVTFSTTAFVYAPQKDRYTQYNPKNAQLQVKSGKKWKTIKILKLSKGKASVTLNESRKKTYRVSIPKGSYAIAEISKSVNK